MSYEPTREWNAFVIVAMVIYRYIFFVIALLIVFVSCTAGHIDIAPFSAYKLVPTMGHFWFPLSAQYEAIKFTSGEVNARNYAFFNLILMCMYPVVLLYTAYYYNEARKKCEFPKVGNERDVTICMLVLAAGIIA